MNVQCTSIHFKIKYQYQYFYYDELQHFIMSRYSQYLTHISYMIYHKRIERKKYEYFIFYFIIFVHDRVKVYKFFYHKETLDNVQHDIYHEIIKTYLVQLYDLNLSE